MRAAGMDDEWIHAEAQVAAWRRSDRSGAEGSVGAGRLSSPLGAMCVFGRMRSTARGWKIAGDWRP